MPTFHESKLTEEDLTELSLEEFEKELNEKHKHDDFGPEYIRALVEMAKDGELVPHKGTDGELYLEPVVKVSQIPAEA